MNLNIYQDGITDTEVKTLKPTHICSLCKTSYPANYSGRFPLCLSCLWNIHSTKKDYHYCENCNSATLVTVAQSNICCNEETLAVREILNGVNTVKLEEWAESRGLKENVVSKVFILLDKNKLVLGYSSKYKLSSIGTYNKTNSYFLYVENEEEVKSIAKLIGAVYCNEVTPSKKVNTVYSKDFIKCSNCEEVLLINHRRDSFKNKLGKCPKCEALIKNCYNCHEVFAITVKEFNWFENRGLAVPVRCKNCRSLRRAKTPLKRY